MNAPKQNQMTRITQFVTKKRIQMKLATNTMIASKCAFKDMLEKSVNAKWVYFLSDLIKNYEFVAYQRVNAIFYFFF